MGAHFCKHALVGNKMQATAIIFEKPGRLVVGEAKLADPCNEDLVVETLWSGISTGTERLLWKGEMPEFPGMGYPLIPGYESVGRVVDASSDYKNRINELVFVPGCASYVDVKGLFGGSASTLLVNEAKASTLTDGLGQDGVLFALAATAHRAVTTSQKGLPDLIIGNGVLGRLAARMIVALGGDRPTVWEKNPKRRDASDCANVIDPATDDAQYNVILDVSGHNEILDIAIKQLMPRGEVILAGFYSAHMSFAFPFAFMKEASIKVSAEWKPENLQAVKTLLMQERLSLGGLITHEQNITQAGDAYETAFSDPECLKMILTWKATT